MVGLIEPFGIGKFCAFLQCMVLSSLDGLWVEDSGTVRQTKCKGFYQIEPYEHMRKLGGLAKKFLNDIHERPLLINFDQFAGCLIDLLSFLLLSIC